ncbi:MAG: acyltransferase, partial [Spirochaetales bacterium]|nr:acyltransferase [Spirochaetales bacterium]
MDFDDIRPYTDEELPSVLKRIRGNKWVLEGIRTAYFSKLPKVFNKYIESIIHQFLKFKTSRIKTTDQFREKISLNILVKNLVRDTTAGISSTGLENLDLNKNYIFISNHRDIVLDPAFMISTLYYYGFNFPQIAFGDNLMLNEIVADIIRVNNGIIV